MTHGSASKTAARTAPARIAPAAAGMMTLTLILSGCNGMWTGTDAVSGQVLCDETRAERVAHAHALLDDGGSAARATGRTLLATMQAGCDE